MPRSNQQVASDVHVGQRLRERRTLMGMTQTAVGNKLGLTFQQIQKYELGTNRIGASRLWQLCGMLDVDPNYFFEGLSQKQAAFGNKPARDIMKKRETLELVKNYYLIDDEHQRRMAYDVLKTLAGNF